MGISAKKSKSKQQSGLNPYSQLAARALMAAMFGQDQFDNLGVGSFVTPGGGEIPDSAYGDLSGAVPGIAGGMSRLDEMRNALSMASGFGPDRPRSPARLPSAAPPAPAPMPEEKPGGGSLLPKVKN